MLMNYNVNYILQKFWKMALVFHMVEGFSRIGVGIIGLWFVEFDFIYSIL